MAPRFRFLGHESDEGATALEYGLLVAFIALAIVAGIAAYGTSLQAFISDLAEQAATILGG